MKARPFLFALLCAAALAACERATAPVAAKAPTDSSSDPTPPVSHGDSTALPAAPLDTCLSDSALWATAPTAWPFDSLVATPIPTYDGSGQSLHPSVLYFPTGWHGWRFVMGYTPYPALDPSFENPSIAVSQDGLAWTTPSGTHNPILAGSGRSIAESDDELLYVPATDQMELCGRQYQAMGGEEVLCETSADLATWSAPDTVLVGAGGERISPTFVLDDAGGWRAWFVRGACGDPGSTVLTATATDTAPVPTDLQQPGRVIWHIQVRYFAGFYWALYAAYHVPAHYGCTNGDLFLARSPDGLHWTTSATPVLAHAQTVLSCGLYRSSLVYDSTADVLMVFASGFIPSGWNWKDGPTLEPRQGSARFPFAALRSKLGL